MQYVVGIILMAGLIISFMFLWVMNKKTPIPKGAYREVPKCQGCSNTSCGHRVD